MRVIEIIIKGIAEASCSSALFCQNGFEPFRKFGKHLIGNEDHAIGDGDERKEVKEAGWKQGRSLTLAEISNWNGRSSALLRKS